MATENETPSPERKTPREKYTGRTLVVFDRALDAPSMKGMRVFDPSTKQLDGEPTYFPNLGIAVIGEGDVLPAAVRDRIIAREPETWVHALESLPEPRFDQQRDAAAQTTWGISEIGAATSPASGKGVTVAVLDTGFDATHPDFAGRTIIRKSFVPNEGPDDGDGHGTHCVGTACGPLSPQSGPRYGVAFESTIAAGKVLGDDGFGKSAWVIAGMDWAVSIGARVISMSLGSAVQPGDPHSVAYEAAAARALAMGTIVVAAAGNESDRPNYVRPVGSPANCPSILAVAAVAKNLSVASFSCAQMNSNGGELNVAAPGVGVLSAAPGSGYATKSGTSMATPHVAGIAAQRIQGNPAITAQELWRELQTTCRHLADGKSDVGSGLAQSP